MIVNIEGFVSQCLEARETMVLDFEASTTVVSSGVKIDVECRLRKAGGVLTEYWLMRAFGHTSRGESFTDVSRKALLTIKRDTEVFREMISAPTLPVTETTVNLSGCRQLSAKEIAEVHLKRHWEDRVLHCPNCGVPEIKGAF